MVTDKLKLLKISIKVLEGIKKEGKSPDRKVATAESFVKKGFVKRVKDNSKLSGFRYNLTKKGEEALKTAKRTYKIFK